MSLPSSPVRKEPADSFDPLEQLSKLVGRGARHSGKKTTSTTTYLRKPDSVGGALGLKDRLENKQVSKCEYEFIIIDYSQGVP